MAFCRKCGEEIDNEAVICPKCGVPQRELKTNSSQREYDDQSSGLPIVSALIPLIGFVLALVFWVQYKRKAAKECLFGALIGLLITYVVLMLIDFDWYDLFDLFDFF